MSEYFLNNSFGFFCFLTVPMSKVGELWKIYSKHALSADGKYLVHSENSQPLRELCSLIVTHFISQMKHEFFKLIQYKETCLTDQMFKLVGKYCTIVDGHTVSSHVKSYVPLSGTKSDQAMTFGEFVEVMQSCSCFEGLQLHPIFTCYDRLSRRSVATEGTAQVLLLCAGSYAQRHH